MLEAAFPTCLPCSSRCPSVSTWAGEAERRPAQRGLPTRRVPGWVQRALAGSPSPPPERLLLFRRSFKRLGSPISSRSGCEQLREAPRGCLPRARHPPPHPPEPLHLTVGLLGTMSRLLPRASENEGAGRRAPGGAGRGGAAGGGAPARGGARGGRGKRRLRPLPRSAQERYGAAAGA